MNVLLRVQYICYGANEKWDVRIHMQGFIYKGEVKKQAMIR